MLAPEGRDERERASQSTQRARRCANAVSVSLCLRERQSVFLFAGIRVIRGLFVFLDTGLFGRFGPNAEEEFVGFFLGDSQ